MRKVGLLLKLVFTQSWLIRWFPHSPVLQACIYFLLWPCLGLLGLTPECRDRRCSSISLDKLLDRVIQHAELIYRVSEESCELFEETFIPLPVPTQQLSRGGNTCGSKGFTFSGSKGETQQISDKWLLHTVLVLIQSWVEPLLGLQVTLGRYDNAPDVLISKTKWVCSKLQSLQQGVTVLTRKMLDESTLVLENHSLVAEEPEPMEMVESVLRDYALLACFKKDAHKVETFLKLLKCRQTDSCNNY